MKSRTGLILICVFLAMSIGIGTGGYFSYKGHRDAIEAEAGNQLRTAADLKVRELSDWREGLLGNGKSITASTGVMPPVTRVLEGKASPREISAVQDYLEQLCRVEDYTGAVLVGADGTIRVKAGQILGPDSHLQSRGMEVVKQAAVDLTDLDVKENHSSPHFGLGIPWRSAPREKPSGALLISINPTRYLYPLLQSWPTSSRSAEVLLVRPDGESVVYLNDLRHRAGAPRLRLPTTATDVPAVKGVLGFEGLTRGTDYRGVAVMAFVRRVPSSPWVLVAKQDLDEIYAPARREALYTGLFAGILILIAGAATALVWKHLVSKFLKQEYEKERQYRTLLERYANLSRYANDIILVMNDGGDIVEANERAVIKYKLPREKLIGTNIRALRDPGTMEQFDKQWNASNEVDGVLFETVHRDADGNAFPVEVSVRRVEADGLVLRQSIIRDISERMAGQERFRRVVENAPEGIFIETDFCFRYLNPQALRLLGAERAEQLDGKPIIERVHHDFRAAFTHRIRATSETEPPLPPGRKKMLRLDDSEIDVELSAVPFTHEGQDGALVFFRDVTEQNKLQEQFLQAQKLESVGRLAGGVAHDFNNLLTAIIGGTDLALSRVQPGDGALRETLAMVLSAGERAADLTRQLLTFSRKQMISPTTLNLNEIVADVGRMLDRLAGEKIEIATTLEPGLGSVFADAGQLHQVLMNLAVNACDAMPDGGRLSIETANVEVDRGYDFAPPETVPGPYVMLTVADTGFGMDENIRKRIFEPFFTTKPEGKGTGLGLATVFGIVKQSGGWIWVASAPGRGSTFRVFLPRVAPKAEHPVPAGIESLNGSERVLVVEDQENVRELAMKVLREYGYEVIGASSGEEAIAICRRLEEHIDLLLTDLVMPGMNGRDLAECLMTLFPGMKVVYMSGYQADLITGGRVLDASISYLPKPFTPAVLAQKVRATLRSI